MPLQLLPSLWTALALAAPASAPETEPETTAPAWLGVRAGAELDHKALGTQLGLRLPETELNFSRDPPPDAAKLHAYLLVFKQGDAYAMTLMFSDGRAYDRSVSHGDGQVERVIANDLASLMRAAIAGETRADREGVDVEAEAENPLGDEKGDDSASVDDPDEPGDSEGLGGAGDPRDTAPGESAEVPGSQDQGTDPSAPTAVMRAPPSASHELGLSLALDGGLALLAPEESRASFFSGGHLRADFAWPKGAVISASFEARAHLAQLRLGRLGLGLGGGYRWRKEKWEMLALGLARTDFLSSPTVDNLTREELPSETLPPLWGAAGQLSLGWRPPAQLAMRLGAVATFEYMVGSDAGLGAPRILRVDPNETPELMVRAGGPELSLGLEFELWFSLRRSTRTRP
jgi:hypothetical protein